MKKKNQKPKKERKIFNKLKSFKKDVLTLPNLLTTIRIILVPVVLALIYTNTTATRVTALFLYIAASITDYLDGYYARKLESVTITGKLLDPLADKFIVLLTLVVLLKMQEVDLLLVLLILAREFYIFGIRALATEQGLLIAAGQDGKIKAAIQMIAIPFIIASPKVWTDVIGTPFNTPFIGAVLLWISVFFSYQSALDYTLKLKRKIFETRV